MNGLFLLMMFFFEISFVAAARKNSLVPFTAIKLECGIDENFMSDLICEMVPLTTGGANITVAATILSSADKVWISVQNYQKYGKNTYRPGFISAVIDVCDFGNALGATFIKEFAESALRDVRQYLHACPYEGVQYWANLTLDGSVYVKILRPGAYRFDYRVYNEQNETYFHMEYYGKVNYRP